MTSQSPTAKTIAFVVNYSTGTSRHDEKRYTKRILANGFAQAADVAQRFAALRPGVVITGIALETPPFA